MFSRRPGERMTRGRIQQTSTTVAPVTPITIFGSANLHWLRSDLGVTTVGSNITAWADQGGLLKDFTEATNPPAYFGSGGPNNRAYVQGDGVIQQLRNVTFALGDPSVTPVFFWLVCRQDTWTINEDIISGIAGSTSMAFRQSVSTPRVAMMSSAAVNTVTTFNTATWGALSSQFTGSVADYLQLNDAAPITGGNAGTTACTGRNLFTNRNSSSWTAASIAEAIIFIGTPTGGQITQLSTYRQGLYAF